MPHLNGLVLFIDIHQVNQRRGPAGQGLQDEHTDGAENIPFAGRWNHIVVEHADHRTDAVFVLLLKLWPAADGQSVIIIFSDKLLVGPVETGVESYLIDRFFADQMRVAGNFADFF